MVIKDPNYKKKKQEEERLNTPEDERKEALISELRKESVSIICLALMYAKNFEETEEDLTKRLINANQNADLLQRVYNKGYEEGIDKGREIERGKNNKVNNYNTSNNSHGKPGKNKFPRT